MPEWTDDQVNEWSLQVKQEKFERAARAGWGSEKEKLSVRLKDLNEEIDRLEAEKAGIVNKVVIASRKRDEVKARLEELENHPKPEG